MSAHVDDPRLSVYSNRTLAKLGLRIEDLQGIDVARLYGVRGVGGKRVRELWYAAKDLGIHFEFRRKSYAQTESRTPQILRKRIRAWLMTATVDELAKIAAAIERGDP